MKHAALSLVFLVLFFSAAAAWDCDAHKYVCQKAGLANSADCCAADQPEFQKQHAKTSPYYHHCHDNASACSARLVADDYAAFSDADSVSIAAHLYADSLTPAHWYSTDYESCHRPFEDEVGERVKTGTAGWRVEQQCVTKDSQQVTLYADQAYLDAVADYVKEKLGGQAGGPGGAQSQQSGMSLEKPSFALLFLAVLLLALGVVLRRKKK